MLINGKIIFFAPLDWGLGHATRSVPVIRELAKNNAVILGITPLTAPVLDEEFPELRKIPLPAYNVRYSTWLPLWMRLGLDSPRISVIAKKEQRCLEQIAAELKPDVVISDNRFGLHTKKAHCIFITHQLFLKTPVLHGMMQNINESYISKFDEVWVPDYEAEEKSLSGELSHNKTHFHDQVKYIGPQSRLAESMISPTQKKHERLILLSGPEPARTQLEKLLLRKFKGGPGRTVLVRGTKGGATIEEYSNFEVHDFPTKEVLRSLILSAEEIICRSGYSTLMDLHLLGVDKTKLTLIPTPGQTEQEYLADYWSEKFGAQAVLQKELKNIAL